MQDYISVPIEQRNIMSENPRDRFNISGKVLLSYLNELVSLVGEKSVIMVLKRSGWMNKVRTIVNTRHEKTAPYEALVKINNEIEDIFGNTAPRTLVYSSAKRSFASCFGGTEATRETLRWLQKNPQSTLRLRVSLETISHLIQATSDQKIKIEESSSHYHLTVQQCAACWGLSNKHSPSCFYNVGLIRGGLHYLFGRDDYPVQELACISTGDKACEFIVRKFPFNDNEKGSGKTGFLTLPDHLR